MNSRTHKNYSKIVPPYYVLSNTNNFIVKVHHTLNITDHSLIQIKLFNVNSNNLVMEKEVQKFE